MLSSTTEKIKPPPIKARIRTNGSQRAGSTEALPEYIYIGLNSYSLTIPKLYIMIFYNSFTDNNAFTGRASAIGSFVFRWFGNK